MLLRYKPCGVGSIPKYLAAKMAWISQVDKALYLAKEKGRDRTQKIQLDTAPVGSTARQYG